MFNKLKNILKNVQNNCKKNHVNDNQINKNFNNFFLKEGIVIGNNFMYDFNNNIIGETYKNPVAVACINYIASNIRHFNIEYNFQKFCDINIVNFLEEILLQWLLYGNIFIKVERFNNCKYKLHVLESGKIKINHNNENIKKLYYIKNKKLLEEELSNIIHIKNYNPFSTVYGFTPLKVIISHILQYNAINDYMLDIASKGGMTSGIIISRHELSSKNRESLKSQISNFYNKINKGGTIMVLEGDFSWEKISLSPQDLESKKIINQNACAIARGLGVPPLLIGLEQQNNGHSGLHYKEVRHQFVSDTLFPLYDKIIDSFVHQLEVILKTSIKITIHYDSDQFMINE